MAQQREFRNPFPTVDVILQRGSQVLMIRRKKDPFKGRLALPGGYINRGETAEDAARREAMEEVSLEVEPVEILGVYSDPARDPRGHTMSVAFVGIILGDGKEEGDERKRGKGEGSEGVGEGKEPKAGDDAAAVEWVDIDGITGMAGEFAFDHLQILLDYRSWRKSSPGGTFWSTKRRSS